MPYQRELKYGVIIAFLTILWMIGEFQLASVLNRPDLGETTGFFASLIPIVGITLGIRSKKQAQQGRLTFAEALASGMVISLIAGVATALFVWIYFSWQTDALNIYFAYLEQSLAKKGLSAEQIATQMERAKTLFTPRNQAASFVVSSLVAGFIISSVVGFFSRSKSPQKKTDDYSPV